MPKGDVIKYVSFIDEEAGISKVVPVDKVGEHDYRYMIGHATLITTATVGSRLLFITLKDADGNTIYHSQSTVEQPANKTYHYQICRVSADAGKAAPAGVDFTIQLATPTDLVVPKGWTLTVEDINAVDVLDTFHLSGLLEVRR